MSKVHLKIALAALAAGLCVAGLATSFIPPSLAQTSANVTIANFSFNPPTVTVVIGVNSTVVWTNTQNGVAHTVTADNGTWGMPAGQSLNSGQSFSHTFSQPGTYPYHCSIHSFMTGKVIVLEASSQSTTSQSTTTASSSTAASTTTSTHSSTIAPTSSTTTSSSTTSGGIPEFPYASAAVILVAGLVAASYLLARRSSANLSRTRSS